MSTKGPDVYLYEFARAPVPLLMGAFHAVELPYVFGTLDLFSWLGVIRQADRELSAAMRGYWTRFAATGDPNGEGVPLWPRYDEASDLHLRLDSTISAAERSLQRSLRLGGPGAISPMNVERYRPRRVVRFLLACSLSSSGVSEDEHH